MLVETDDAEDKADGMRLAGRLIAGAHLTKLDGMVPLPDDGQLGRAWVVDWLAGRPHLWGPLRELSWDTLGAPMDHLKPVEALIHAVKGANTTGG